MKLTPIALTLTLLCATSALAKDYVVRAELNDHMSTGRAKLDLEGTPRLRMQLQGSESVDMPGLEVFHGYLFTRDTRALEAVLRSSQGIVGAMQPVERVTTANVLASGMRVRAEPSTEAAVVGKIRRNQRLEVLEVQNGWAKIKVDWSTTGWALIQGDKTFLQIREVPKLDRVPGATSILLTRSGPGWEGSVRNEEGASMGTIVLRNPTPSGGAKRMLVVPDARNGKDGRAFASYAYQLKQTYSAQGYSVAIADVDSWEDVIDELNAASGAPFSRVVFIAHGGWDGAILRSRIGASQVSGKQNEELFAKLIAAINVGTTPTARMFSSSCHAGGTARAEDVSFTGSRYRWVHDVANRTGRQVAGPAGLTSTDYTHQHVLAALEGQGTVRQEVHVARGSRLRILFPGQTLAQAQTRPLPPILDLPELERAAQPESWSTTVRASDGENAAPLPHATVRLGD